MSTVQLKPRDPHALPFVKLRRARIPIVDDEGETHHVYAREASAAAFRGASANAATDDEIGIRLVVLSMTESDGTPFWPNAVDDPAEMQRAIDVVETWPVRVVTAIVQGLTRLNGLDVGNA